LLGAQFEETIRQLAKEFARIVVSRLSKVDELPPEMAITIWKRSLERLSKQKITGNNRMEVLAATVKNSRTIFDTICEFLEGSLTLDVYDHLIHNENNMRYNEINGLFKVSGLSNACQLACAQAEMKSTFDDDDQNRVDGSFMRTINEFFELRNSVAHSLNSTNSVGLDVVKHNMDVMRAFVVSLGNALKSK
jgi:hypothetical protein